MSFTQVIPLAAGDDQAGLPGQVAEEALPAVGGTQELPTPPARAPPLRDAHQTAGQTTDEMARILVQEQRKVCDFLTTWTNQQSALWTEQVTKNNELLSSFLDMHRQTLQNMEQVGECGSYRDIRPTPLMLPSKVDVATDEPPKRPSKSHCEKGLTEGKAAAVADDLEALEKDEVLLDAWRRSSGLQTVDKWVKNYRKHPAGWGALLMIHGIPEVTGRLRTKVENYAIYSALFLSMSIALMVDAPTAMTNPNENVEWSIDWWMVEIRRRTYFYGMAIGTGAHMLSILLGMAFVNALNETARDADVFRMFSQGKGFAATVKCQYSFRVGCVFNYLSMGVAATAYIHWAEVLVIAIGMICVTGRTLYITSNLLFSTGSICRYWREELGGKPHPSDPYDLNIPQRCFEQRVQVNAGLFSETGLFNVDASPETPGVQNDLFNQLRREEGSPKQVKAQVVSGVGGAQKKGMLLAALS